MAPDYAMPYLNRMNVFASPSRILSTTVRCSRQLIPNTGGTGFLRAAAEIAMASKRLIEMAEFMPYAPVDFGASKRLIAWNTENRSQSHRSEILRA
jgi:hypothetical protein